MDKELVVYVRSAYCPYVALARDLLNRYGVRYREINIDTDPVLARRVREWTGFHSVPTLVVAAPGEDIPYDAPAPLPSGHSPKSIDRGPMITEPNNQGLENWLHKHGFLTKAYKR